MRTPASTLPPSDPAPRRAPRQGGPAARRIRILLGIALASCLVAPSARAEWVVDASVEHFALREHITPIEVHENGPRAALGIGFILPKARGLLFAYRGVVYGGGVGYNGSFQFDRTEAAHGTSIYLGTTQAVELRYRWPGALDAIAGLDVDIWRRRLSTTQYEDYRFLSGRVGLRRPATAPGRVVAGGGVRFLLATAEHAMVTDAGLSYRLILSPGLGANPFLELGYQVTPRVTATGYWDGMRLGRTDPVVLRKNGRPQATVFQPATDIDVVGVRIAYRL
jgi:hypothetical protein